MFRYVAIVSVVLVSLYANEALEAFKNKDYDKAFKLYKIKAKEGDNKAQGALSYLYSNGLGTLKDSTLSLFWLQKAANGSNANAQYDLGMKYLSGYGVNKDAKKAFDLLTKSSNLSNINAQYNLALMYYNGDTVDQNVTKTAELLDKAAVQGHKGAIQNIGRIYMQLLKFDKASKWLEINAQEGDDSSYFLAEIYCELEKFKQAKKWAKKAMDTGNKDAEGLWQKYRLEKY